MNIDLKTYGIDAAMRALEDISTTVDRGVNRVLRDSAEPLMESIRNNTPVHAKGPTRDSVGHAKDHVVRSNVKRKDDTKVVEVGYDGQVGWYMWFLEKGTYSGGNPDGIPAQHNVERAFETAKPEVVLIQENGLRRLVAKYVS